MAASVSLRELEDTSVIDLTDEEPPKKKILLNNRQIKVHNPNHISQTSQQCLPVAGTPVNGCATKGEGCYTCEDTTSTIIHLECQHRFCYEHFFMNLQQMKTPESSCFIFECKRPISDKIIKDGLLPLDYISYLELTRENFRRAIQPQIVELECINLDSQTTDDSHVERLSEEVPESENNVNGVLRLEEPNGQQSEFLNLQNLDTMSFIKNIEPFQCPICFVDYGVQEGVILKNCFHSFCVECISATVQHSDEPSIICPFISDIGACEFFIQDREIRGIVPPEIYERHLKKALNRAETNLDNIYHCKTIDCGGFIQYEEAMNAFPCPVCDKVNCVKCMAIHEEKTCDEHKMDLKNDVKNQEELKMTEKAVERMLKQGKAMMCPKCNILIQKTEGCDHVTCVSCKLGICYRTKKPRQPLTKTIDGVEIVIDGCHCRENGKLCHPRCGGCH